MRLDVRADGLYLFWCQRRCLQVEGVFMSLSAWEQRALHSIGNGIAESDPELADSLDAFTLLTSGREIPSCERITRVSWSGMRRSLRNRRCPRQSGLRYLAQAHRRLGLRWLWLWPVLAVALAMIVLSLIGGTGASWSGLPRGLACAAPTSHPPAPTATATVSHGPGEYRPPYPHLKERLVS